MPSLAVPAPSSTSSRSTRWLISAQTVIVSIALPANWLYISWALALSSIVSSLCRLLVECRSVSGERLTRRVIAVKRFRAARQSGRDMVSNPLILLAFPGRSAMADDTLGRMFWSRVERGGDGPAQQFKRGGTWETLNWRQVGEAVKEVALGLIALGRRQGDAVALLSASRAEWVQADMAIFTAGCVTVPIYPSYPPDLIAYVVNDSQARTLIVEDPGQLAKALEARPKMDGLQQIVVISGYDAPQPPEMVLTWQTLRRLGRDKQAALRSTLAERLAATRPEDVATIVYTSGTTGPPKGVIQTHANHIAAVTAAGQTTPEGEGWVPLPFLPLAHPFARLESLLRPAQEHTTAFRGDLDQGGEHLREVRPHFICSVPRVFEKVYAKILAGVHAGSPLKKRIFHWALDVGGEGSRRQQ